MSRPAPTDDDLMASITRMPLAHPSPAEVERNRAEARRELIEFIEADDGRDCGRRLA